MIRQSSDEPEVIEYLNTPLPRARLVELIAAVGITPRKLLREKGTPMRSADCYSTSLALPRRLA